MEITVNRPLLCAELIGRDPELAEMSQLLGQAKAGRGRLVLVSGEAGVGKSRLVREVKSQAEVEGFLVVQGACFPTDPASPYAPVLELIRSLFGQFPAGELVAALGPLAPLLFPLLPDLIPPPPEQVALPVLESEQAKRRLEALLAQFFLGRAEGRPLLLIVEDLHWSDPSSLDFLSYLGRRAGSVPLLLVVTYRHEDVETPLGIWLTQVERERLASEVRLQPLSRLEVDWMLTAIFDERHTSFDLRRFLHGELLETLYMLTEGNPFFIEETLSALLAAGDIFPVGGYWNRRGAGTLSIPRSVQDAVQRRIAALTPEARYILTLAAIAGRRFDFELLQQLTRYPERQLLQYMKELVAAQLVTETEDDQFAFRHALTRQAIYSQLLSRERRLLHLTVAQTMEQAAPEAVIMHLEDLASHFYQARDWPKVLEYAQRAGEKVEGLHAHRAATAFFTWVLEAHKELTLLPPPVVYRARGQAYEALGEFERAEQDYTRALETASLGSDPVAEWQSAIDLGFLWAGRDYGQTETWFRRALHLAESLDDPRLHARSLNRLGNWYLNVEQPHEGLRAHQEALLLFRRLQDGQGIAETLDLLGMASYLGGDLIGGTAYYRQAIAGFYELQDQAGLTSSLATLALRGPTYQTDALVSAGSLAEGCRDAEEALKIARAIGHRSAEAYALFQMGLCLGSQGEYGQALATVRESLDIAEEIEHRQWQSAAHTILAGLYSGALAFVEAREHAEQALALARETGTLFWTRIATGYLASIVVLQHAPAQAEELLRQALDPLDSEAPAATMSERMLWCAAVELALEQGNAHHAMELLERLSASVSSGQSSLRVLRLRGEVLLALQRSTEAESVLLEALALAAKQGARPIHWRIALTLGRLYHEQGRAAESEQASASARTEIEAIAASLSGLPLREHFWQEATALLPPPVTRTSEQRDRQAFGGLTAREREVAILIARGASNQDIANVLVVTKRTVETHIGNILFKLGARSRTQIAVWAVESGLTSGLDPSL